MYKHLLVPLDSSGLATEIVSQAVPFAAALGARITFFTAQADFGSTESGALQRTVAPEAYADNLAGDARGILQKAEAAAKSKGVSCSSLTLTSDRPYIAILATAEAQGCDLIFMASHGRKGLESFLLGSQTQKVLSNTRIPVLVATVESNQKDQDRLMAVAIIQDEHRSMAAVMRGLIHLVQEAVEGKSTLNIDLARSMIHYINMFPERLHHPKEEAFLFELLASRTSEYDEVFKELRTQHASGEKYIKAMEHALEQYVKTKSVDELTEMSTSVNVYAKALWEHMNVEENVILPLAKTHLTSEDWAKIHTAFSENGDPRFDVDVADDFKHLFSKIMNLAKN